MKNLDTFLEESNKIEGVDDQKSFDNAKKAWEYLMVHDILTVPNVLETHSILMQNREAWEESTIAIIGKSGIGAFRTFGITVGGKKGMNHEDVPRELESWCALQKKLPPRTENDLKLLHIHYEAIHPFADGNGRTGRLFYNWARVKLLKKPIKIFYEKNKEKYYKWFR